MPTFEVVVDEDDRHKVNIGFDVTEWEHESHLHAFFATLTPIVEEYLHEALTEQVLSRMTAAVLVEIRQNTSRFDLYQHRLTKKWVYRYGIDRAKMIADFRPTRRGGLIQQFEDALRGTKEKPE